MCRELRPRNCISLVHGQWTLRRIHRPARPNASSRHSGEQPRECRNDRLSRQHDYFSGVLAGGIDQDPETASQVGQSVNGFGVLGGNRLDLGQGEIRATGNPLDLALEGQGFFAIQTRNGVRYTRDGAFSRSSTGVLQTTQGEPVLDANQKPITIPTAPSTSRQTATSPSLRRTAA